MEYRVEKISESFDRRMFTFASMSEAEQWLRLFPQPMPETHRLAYHWQPNQNPKAPPVLVVEVEQRPETAEAAKPADAPVVGSRYAALAAMSEADLETILVEMGVGMPLALPGRKPTKAMLASRVYTEEKRRAEKKPANNAA